MRRLLLGTCALWTASVAWPAVAQDLQDRAAQPAPPAPPAANGEPVVTAERDPKAEEITFSADQLEYDNNADIVTATGDVRMYRDADRLRADKVIWNRRTGKVMAQGNVVIVNPTGDTAYGDAVELTDSLRDGVVDNMLVVLDRGGRIAARRGVRDNGVVTLTDAAYTPCAVTDSAGCPKSPTWKVTAVRVVYNPDKRRIYFTGAQLSIFGVATIPLPALSTPVGGGSNSGLLSPDIRYSRVNGVEYAQPYFISIDDNRNLTITPRFFSRVLPMIQADYNALTSKGAYHIGGYATESDRTDAIAFGDPADATTRNVFRGYLEANGRFQLDPNWSVSGSFRVATDRTFLRRYFISFDDLLRNTINVSRIDRDSYFAVTGWAVQTLRVNDRQGLQPVALPEIDYRRRFRDVLGGVVEAQVNTLAIGRTAGQDTQRAFTSVRWDLRRLTPWGQEITLTAFGRADLYHASDTAATTVTSYRGREGFTGRGIAAFALDVKWPLIGTLLGGLQRLTPRVQLVATPPLANLIVPNEDSRAVELDDSNLFSLNRFPGYDRFDDSTRLTYGLEWGLTLPNFTVNTVVGQSIRLTDRNTVVPAGVGFDERVSDFVGRTEVRYKDIVTVTHRFRLDKDSFKLRREVIDATIGSRASYFQIGYLLLNRQIAPTLEDLRDREEVRLAARVQLTRFWSAFGSTTVDLTTRQADPLSLTDGFAPIRHRIGVAYEDDCLRLGATWRRDYQNTGDARSGDAILLTLSFKNLGR